MTEWITEQTPKQTAGAASFAPDRNPARVVWAAGLFALLWILPLLIQSVFSPRTTFCADALYFSSLAVVACGLYFVCLPGAKRKITGGALALFGAALLAFSASIARNIKAYAFHIDLFALFSLRNNYLFLQLRNALLCVALAVAAALLVWRLACNRPMRARFSAAGAAAAGVYFLGSFALTLWMYRFQLMMGDWKLRNYATLLSEQLLDALCLYLVFLALGYLGSMEHTRVKLKGIGLVWAWLALCGMSLALLGSVALGDRLAGPGSYTTQFVLLSAGIAGYALLLFRRRVGLYVLLLGTGLLLGAQTLGLLNGVLYGANGYGALLAGSILSGLNPLFAALAVRAGVTADDPAAAGHADTTVAEP